MSWRVLIIILVLAGIGSWWGGVELGEWLVKKAPDAISSANGAKTGSAEATLDANGQPYVAQPPQPRIDGTLGIPKEFAAPEWTILPITVDGVVRDSDDMIRIDVPKAEADMEHHEAAVGGSDLPQGPVDVVTIDVPKLPEYRTPTAPAPTVVAPPSKSNPPPARSEPKKPAVTTDNKAGWQQALKTDIGRCGQFGFFDRPRCIEQVQRKYCGPNNAWGKIPDCPDPGGSPSRAGG